MKKFLLNCKIFIKKYYKAIFCFILISCILFALTSVYCCKTVKKASASSSDSYPRYDTQGYLLQNEHYIFSDLFTVNLFTDFNDTVLTYTGNGLVIDDNFNTDYPLQSNDNRSNYNYLYYTANNDNLPLLKQSYDLSRKPSSSTLINTCNFTNLGNASFSVSRIRFNIREKFVRLLDLKQFIETLEVNASSYCEYDFTYGYIDYEEGGVRYTSLNGNKNMSSTLVFQTGYFDKDLSINDSMKFFNISTSNLQMVYIKDFDFEIYTYSGTYSYYTYESSNLSYFTSFTDNLGNVSYPYNNLYGDYLHILERVLYNYNHQIELFYDAGYDVGYVNGQEDSISPTGAIFDTVSNFFGMEILPNFTFGWFLSIILGVSGLIILLKMFLGG